MLHQSASPAYSKGVGRPDSQATQRRSDWPLDEPSIGELLSDPIVRAMMNADGVEPEHIAVLLGRVQRQVRFNGLDQPTVDATPDFMKSLCNAPKPTHLLTSR
jgi:hypothetical protein